MDLPTPKEEDGLTKEERDKKAMEAGVFVSKAKGILDDLPDYTKNPKNYMKIQKELLESLACRKDHADPSEMFDCKTCQQNAFKRRKLMKKYGFTSPAQYMAWKKTHEEIRKMMPLVDWDNNKMQL